MTDESPTNWEPTPRQSEFLSATEDEVLFGGAAGGGKSDALLIDALGLQQGAIFNKRYRALIIRQTSRELRDLIDRSRIYYPMAVKGDVIFNEEAMEWRFPSGAKVILGHCEREVDVLAYQGQEFQWIGIDELGHYRTPYVMDYLTSRLRAIEQGKKTIKCYFRATCNPGPKWIRQRFGFSISGEPSTVSVPVEGMPGKSITRRFIPSRLSDNKHVAEGYEARLRLLPEAERAALLYGLWEAEEVNGAVYKHELSKMREDGRITSVPYETNSLVSVFCDLGWADSTCLIFAQWVGREPHIIDYLEANNKPAAWYVAEMRKRPYQYSSMWLPHDAYAKDKGTGKSYDEIVRALGIKTERVPSLSVDDGVRATRTLMDKAWIDSKKCERLVECLKNYRWKYGRDGETKKDPVHDWASHGADAMRYCAIAFRPHQEYKNVVNFQSYW